MQVPVVSWMCRLLLLRPLLLSASLLTSVQAQHKSRSHCPLRLHRTRTYKQSGCASAFSDTAPSCKRNPYSSPSGLSPAPPRLCTGMHNTNQKNTDDTADMSKHGLLFPNFFLLCFFLFLSYFLILKLLFIHSCPLRFYILSVLKIPVL